MTKAVLYVAVISISIYELSLKATNKTVARLLRSVFLIIYCRQRGRVVKAPGLCPTRSRLKTHSGHSVVSLGRTLYGVFLFFVVLASSSKLLAISDIRCSNIPINYSHVFIKIQADSNTLVSPEVGRGNCLPYVLAPPSLSCKSGG